MAKASDEILQFRDCLLLRDHALVNENLWIRNGKIINPEPLFYVEHEGADVQIDCDWAIIAPGFIDVQINGGFGVDFSANTGDIQQGIQKVAKGILSNGVTSFCPTLVTSPTELYHQVIRLMPFIPQLLPLIPCSRGGKHGASVLGVHVEGPFINKEKRGAHPQEFIRTISNGLQDVIDTYGSLSNIAMITMAPEIPQALEVIEQLALQGITVSLGHSMGSLGEGEASVNRGAKFITHLFNAMLPFHHRDPGLVGLLASDFISKVYYGIIADGIHTHPAALRIAFRTNPHGLVLVTDAISAMGLGPGKHPLGHQTIEIEENRACISGTQTLCGSIATMDTCIKKFKKATGCSHIDALECASLHPAQALALKSKGTLEYGADADFVLLDNDLNVLSTYIEGECVWSGNTSNDLK